MTHISFHTDEISLLRYATDREIPASIDLTSDQALQLLELVREEYNGLLDEIRIEVNEGLESCVDDMVRTAHTMGGLEAKLEMAVNG